MLVKEFINQMEITLAEIQVLVERLAEKINAPLHILPSYGHTRDGAYPHIEISDKGYHYVVVERGEELERFVTESLNELLFKVFRSVTFSMSCDFELKNRIKSQDFRRQLFMKQIELLTELDEEWGQKIVIEKQMILNTHPFID